MIVIDTFLELLVILIGTMLALAVLFPAFASAIGLLIVGIVPHPSEVNEFLKRFGL